MNSTVIDNSIITQVQTWFIPFDIIMIVCAIVSMILATLFLLFIISDKTCHTIPMMLVANTCLTAFILGCLLFSFSLFTLQSDHHQTVQQDSFCIFRAYVGYVSASLFHYSILLQTFYRYIIVVYSNRLFWQSYKCQCLVICMTWIFSFLHPFTYMFNNQIIYNVDNQICQLPLQVSFYLVYMSFCVYLTPVSMIMLLYFKLVRYVQWMRKRITPINIITRARQELKMVQHIVIVVTVILVLGLPYTIFIVISFFTSPPKYHFRIAYIFVNVSLPLVMIALFHFTDPLKSSIMRKIKRRPNRIVQVIIA